MESGKESAVRCDERAHVSNDARLGCAMKRMKSLIIMSRMRDEMTSGTHKK